VWFAQESKLELFRPFIFGSYSYAAHGCDHARLPKAVEAERAEVWDILSRSYP
jgi:hypothetical protein